MQDVKDLIKVTWSVLAAGWLAIFVMGAVLANRRGWDHIALILDAGARGTIWLMLILVVGLIAAFGVVFVGFHRIFFEGDTWLFAYSNTFIRLYPERFWRDTFALVAIITLVLSWAIRSLPKRFLKLRT